MNKHYEAIASILLECRSNPALLEFYDADSVFWHKLNMHFAARLATMDNNFKMNKFIEACKDITKPKTTKKKKKTEIIRKCGLPKLPRAGYSPESAQQCVGIQSYPDLDTYK